MSSLVASEGGGGFCISWGGKVVGMFFRHWFKSHKMKWPYHLPPHPPFQVPRNQWVLQWPGQVVICVSSIFWTKEVSQALVEKTLPVSEPVMKLVEEIQARLSFEWHILKIALFSEQQQEKIIASNSDIGKARVFMGTVGWIWNWGYPGVL